MNAHLEFIGVTGVAFHPHFLDDRNKRFLYVRYNAPAPNTTTIIERYHVPPGTLSADPATATLFFSFPTVETGHGSGQIHFDTRELGPNMTLLYFTMPDDKVGSATCAEKEIVQDDGSRLGKFFALNVEEGSPPAILPEPAMLGKGLRNPFGMSVDRGDGNGQGLGDVWIGNTGPDCPGDILRWVVGTMGVQNYGWPWKIGDCDMFDDTPPVLKDTPCPLPPNPPPFTDPVRVVAMELTSNGNNDAMIGGYVYRGTNVATLTNKYVYALYGKNSPKVLALPNADDPSNGPTENLTGNLGVNTWPAGSLHGLGQDTDGELYLIRVDTNQPVTNNGTIYRID